MPSATVPIRRLEPSPATADTIAAQSALLGELVDERAVDLDLVERKHAQIAERRIAGAEIVENDGNAHQPQLMQRLDMLDIVLQQHRFGDLELQALRRQAGLIQHLAEIVDRVCLAKLHGR